VLKELKAMFNDFLLERNLDLQTEYKEFLIIS